MRVAELRSPTKNREGRMVGLAALVPPYVFFGKEQWP